MAIKKNALVVYFGANTTKLKRGLTQVSQRTAKIAKELTALGTTAAAAFGVSAVKNAIDYEQALVGVGKTADLSGTQLAKFGKEIQNISKDIPVSTKELLEIAQAAGQLGVKGEKNIAKFSATIAKLGRATDLQGEDAAKTLARILTITGEGTETVDTFASVIVKLGNNFAASESEIAGVTSEVAKATSVFGVASGQAAGIAAALQSVGVQAELGGSVVGKAFREIDSALRNGGKALKDLEELTGQTGEQLKKTFQEDSTLVFQQFINGLGNIQRSGGDVAAELEKFNLKGDEVLKTLPVLAKNSQVLGRSLSLAAEETKNATALNNEFNSSAETAASKLQVLSNRWDVFRKQVGQKLIDKGVIDNVSIFVKALTDLEIVDLIGLKFTEFVLYFKQTISVFEKAINRFVANWDRAVSTISGGLRGIQSFTATLSAKAGVQLGIIDVENKAEALKAIDKVYEDRKRAIGENINQEINFITQKEREQTAAIDKELQNRLEVYAKRIEEGNKLRQRNIERNLGFRTDSEINKGVEVLATGGGVDAGVGAPDLPTGALFPQETDNPLIPKPTESFEELRKTNDEQFQTLLDDYFARKETLTSQLQEQEEEQTFLGGIFKLLFPQTEDQFADDQALKDEQFQQQLAMQQERDAILATLDEDQKAEFLKREEDFRNARLDIQTEGNKKSLKDEMESADAMIGVLGHLTGEGKKLQKAWGLAKATVNIATALSEAVVASAGVPFPANIAAIAKSTGAVIAANAGVLSSIRGANQGGIVPGSGNTDSVPMMLTPGEMVVPKQITPTFYDMMKEGGGSMQQRVVVDLNLNENLAEFITAQQRRDEQAGIY